MAARSIASFSVSFGLVSIPVKLYSATESSTALHFKLMGSGGARLRQQYVAEDTPAEPLEEPGSPPRTRQFDPCRPLRRSPHELPASLNRSNFPRAGHLELMFRPRPL